MQQFALSWAAARMRAKITRVDALPESVPITGISTDSRKAGAGTLFFALKGEHADGHEFVPMALKNGAIAIVSENARIAADSGGTLLVVADPLLALGELARAYRSLFPVQVVGITGSVGKTSTREMLAHILRSRFKVLASEKNFNTEIGVPITLFGLNQSHDVAVVEMGMRARGEIRTLAEMAQPNIAIITNIGYAHLQILGSRQAIAEAKVEILEFLPADGVAILPDDLPYPESVTYALPAGTRVIRVGGEGSDVWAKPSAACSGTGTAAFEVHVRATGESAVVSLHVPGAHHSANALLAIAAASELGIPLSQSAAALETWGGTEGRMTIREGKDNITVLEDCYNAGPESMAAALETLRTFEGPRVAILGDMRELGHTEAELHTMLGPVVAAADLRLLVTIGPLAELIANSALEEMSRNDNTDRIETARFATTLNCCEKLDDLVRSGDTVLVKGSRAMQMERIVAQLVGGQVPDHHG